MTRRLRVVHVTGCLDMGGQEKLLVEFAKHADRERFDLRFVSLTTRGILAEELEACGWPVTALDLAPGLHLRVPIRLAKLLRGWQADVVHTHNDRPLLYAAPAARLARVPGVIHTKHGRSTGNSRRQNLLTALTARLADSFVCVSADCATLARHQGVPIHKIHTLHNGIDTRRFPFTGPLPRGAAVVVARLCLDKDLATLLEAAAHVVQDAPDFHLAIAGDGPCLAELKRLADRLELGERVRFLGLVRDVPSLLKQAGIFVLSSISEGVPLTLLEAMASGLPAVATRVGGVPEVLTDEITGLLVPPRDARALASALLRVHRDSDLAHRLGSAGRSLVEDRFDVRDMVARYEEFYFAACEKAARGAACAKPQASREEVQGCASHI